MNTSSSTNRILIAAYVAVGWVGSALASSRWGSRGQAIFLVVFFAIALVTSSVITIRKLRDEADEN